MTASRVLARAGRLPRRTLQVQLTLLYSGAFIALVILMLAAANLLVFRESSPAPGTPGVLPQGAPQALAVLSAVILVVSVVVAIVLGWFIAGRLLARLRRITATARDISVSDLHRRLDLGGPGDEFQELGKTLDDLFSRLEAAFEAQRHFVANASHELRTPLTAERTLLQVALADPDASADGLRATCEQVLQLSTQQEQLIDTLLTLATSERGVERWESADLAGVVEGCVASRRHEADRRGIVIDLALSPARVLGDPALIESLVANLIDNAILHNVSDGRIELETSVSSDGRPTVSVRNTGRLVPADEIDHLFQPFRQLGKERVHYANGHGLGLSIVRAIADAHGGAISAETRKDGGLNVTVVFRRTSD
jgi:signal transduction histidine kinase